MTRIYVHPAPVRLWHWLNALGFVALIVTGLQIRYGVLLTLSFKTVVDAHNAIGFVLIWAALAVYAADSLWRSRK